MNAASPSAQDTSRDLLETAVVDIATLIVTARALRRRPQPPDAIRGRRLRRELRAEFRQAAARYLKALAGIREGRVDAPALAGCRVAAEQALPAALDMGAELRALMSSQPGALAAMAPLRHDLWRLARITIRLREQALALRQSCQAARNADWADLKPVLARLRKGLKRALQAYARACMRSRRDAEPTVAECRRAACARLGEGCLADAARVAAAFERHGGGPTPMELSVVRPLQHLLLDWQGAD